MDRFFVPPPEKISHDGIGFSSGSVSIFGSASDLPGLIAWVCLLLYLFYLCQVILEKLLREGRSGENIARRIARVTPAQLASESMRSVPHATLGHSLLATPAPAEAELPVHFCGEIRQANKLKHVG